MFSVLLAAALAAGPAAAPAVVSVRTPNAVLRLEVASTPAQRERGLMGRLRLAPHTGMLFVFPGDGPVEFWMKDTLVPLDMVFVSPAGVVRSVAARVPTVPTSTPDDRIPRRDGRAEYVIELPAGEAAADAIVPGTRLAGLPLPQ